MFRLVAFLSFVGFASACSRCQKTAPQKDAGASSFEVSSPPEVTAPRWANLPDFAGFGLPPGCRFDGAIRRAELAKGSHVVAGRHRLDAIAIATGSGDHVDRAGLVDLVGSQVEAVPWAKLDAPPLLENRAGGWFAAWTVDEPRRALGWTGGDRARLLAEGDELELVDVACHGERCAALTSLARETRSAGATLTTTDGKSWDIDAPKDEPWAPFGILAFDAEHMRIGLASGKHAAIWEAKTNAAFSQQKLHDAPFGVYGGAGDWIVVPGAAPDRPCGREEFPIEIHDGSRTWRVRTPAPPESIVVRSLGKKLLVGWVAPVSCQLLERRVVYLTLVSAAEAGDASPMAIADASGIALAGNGDRFRLWLLQDRWLTMLSGRC